MASAEKVKGRVIDAHSHIGEMAGLEFYDLKEPVKPTVYEFADAARTCAIWTGSASSAG